MATILAVAEERDGALRKITHEVVAAAGKLSGDVKAKLFTPGNDPDAVAQAIADDVKSNSYDVVIFGATSFGKDMAPRVAAKLDVPLASDVIDVALEDGKVVATRPVYAGRAIAKVSIDATPAIISVRPNVFRAPKEGGDSVENVAVDASKGGRVTIREVKTSEGGKLDVAEAPVIISGGRGLKGPENWHLLESLRDALGNNCALGASRAVVDAGWRPHAEQVGQTGKTVSPQLYIAVGISGAMQHLAGMRSAKTIVAINKDPEAPIFKVADYGIVGDVTEVLPKLTEEIKKQCG
jgi:electron transfer flavoprotein alpha subunit